MSLSQVIESVCAQLRCFECTASILKSSLIKNQFAKVLMLRLHSKVASQVLQASVCSRTMNRNPVTSSVHSLQRQGYPVYCFSATIGSEQVLRSMRIQSGLRRQSSLLRAQKFIEENEAQIGPKELTVLIEALNEYPFTEHTTEHDDSNATAQLMKERVKPYFQIEKLKKMATERASAKGSREGEEPVYRPQTYELIVQFSMYSKLQFYNRNSQDQIQEIIDALAAEITQRIREQQIDVVDAMNLLYAMKQTRKRSTFPVSVIFDAFESNISNERVKSYLINAKSKVKIFLKRILEGDLLLIRRYPHLMRFVLYENLINQNWSSNELCEIALRLSVLKFHLIGKREIPPFVDKVYVEIENRVTKLTAAELSVAFKSFDQMPLSYKTDLFKKIRHLLLNSGQCTTKTLMFLPTSKLTEEQIQTFQEQIVRCGRENLSLSIVYTLYEANWKKLSTPYFKEQLLKSLKETIQLFTGSTEAQKMEQIKLISLIFRLAQENYEVATLQKLLEKINGVLVEDRYYTLLKLISTNNMLSYLWLLDFFKRRSAIEMPNLFHKFQEVIKLRNSNSEKIFKYVSQLESCFLVYGASDTPKVRGMLEFLVRNLQDVPPIDQSEKPSLFFSMNRSAHLTSNSQVLSQFSQHLESEIPLETLVQSYLIFEHKTVHLTTKVFDSISRKYASRATEIGAESRVESQSGSSSIESSIFELLCSLGLRQLTNMKGNMIYPLKNYLNDTQNLTKHEFTGLSSNVLMLSYKILSNFSTQVPEFVRFLGSSTIRILHDRIVNCKQVIKGVHFAHFCNHFFDSLFISGTTADSLKSEVQQIWRITKELRRLPGEGLLIKSFQCSLKCRFASILTKSDDITESQVEEVIATLEDSSNPSEYSELYLQHLKGFCLNQIKLTSSQAELFVGHCMQAIERGEGSLTQLKDILGWESMTVLRSSQSDSSSLHVQRFRLIFAQIIESSFRNSNLSHVSPRVLTYFAELFSLLGTHNQHSPHEFVLRVLSALLQKKLPVSDLPPFIQLLKRLKIKNEAVIERLANYFDLGEEYVSFEDFYLFSWVEKIYYYSPKGGLYEGHIVSKSSHEIDRFVSSAESKHAITAYKLDYLFEHSFRKSVDFAWFLIKEARFQAKQLEKICAFLYDNLDRAQNYLAKKGDDKTLKSRLALVLEYLIDQKVLKTKKRFSKNGVEVEKGGLAGEKKLRAQHSQTEEGIDGLKRQKLLQLSKQLPKFQSLESESLEQLLREKYPGGKVRKGQKIKNFVTEYTVVFPKSEEELQQGKSRLKTHKLVVIIAKPYHESRPTLNQQFGFTSDSGCKWIREKPRPANLQLRGKRLFKSNPLIGQSQNQVQNPQLDNLEPNSRPPQFAGLNGILRAQVELTKHITGLECLVYDPRTNELIDA